MVSFPFGESNRWPREAPSEGGAARQVPHNTPLGQNNSELQNIAWRLMDKSGQTVMLSAPDGKLRYANRAAHLAFGYEWNENTTPALLGHNWLS